MRIYNVFMCLAIILSLATFSGCDSNSAKSSDANHGVVENNPMQYMSNSDLKQILESGSTKTIFLDVRKAADYAQAHVAGAISADLDKAKSGDNADGIAKLNAALQQIGGSGAIKGDTKIVLLCYSGKSYAQKGTDLLLNMGVPAANIVTLQDGYKELGSEDYAKFMISGANPGGLSKE